MTHEFVDMPGRHKIASGGWLAYVRCVKCDRIGKMVVEKHEAAAGTDEEIRAALIQRMSQDRCRPLPHVQIRAEGPHRLFLENGPDLSRIGVAPGPGVDQQNYISLRCERCQQGVVVHSTLNGASVRGRLLVHIERAVDEYNKFVPECRVEAK